MTPPLRIAFDMDGTLADLSSAYAEFEERLFGAADEDAEHPAPEVREAEQQRMGAADPADDNAENNDLERRAEYRRLVERTSTRHRDRVWRAIEATPNFWTTLKPLEEGAVGRLYQLTGELNWEVFFITQRPATAGGTVQCQTHTWLVEHGFRTPSVIPLSSGRGKAAAALRLDYLVDDTPQNCVDVLSDSSTRAILIVDPDNPLAETSARRLGIGVAHSVHEVCDLLVQATDARTNPSLFEKLRKLVGWK
jgi:5' nucleotidase, deoxy (Pyrimidine), cytosolic type C protein (NT5C)